MLIKQDNKNPRIERTTKIGYPPMMHYNMEGLKKLLFTLDVTEKLFQVSKLSRTSTV